jgi:hypothetical protein
VWNKNWLTFFRSPTLKVPSRPNWIIIQLE